MTSYNLVPAYGRDYASQKAVKADWLADKDFIISGIGPDSGRLVNRPQLQAGDVVYIRYNKVRKVMRIEVT